MAYHFVCVSQRLVFVVSTSDLPCAPFRLLAFRACWSSAVVMLRSCCPWRTHTDLNPDTDLALVLALAQTLTLSLLKSSPALEVNDFASACDPVCASLFTHTKVHFSKQCC